MQGGCLVDVVHTREVVQHPLADVQWALGQHRPGTQVDEPPASKCGGGGQGAPVRIGELGERETERRRGPLTRFGAVGIVTPERLAHPLVELDARAHHEHVGLERAEPERLDE